MAIYFNDRGKGDKANRRKKSEEGGGNFIDVLRNAAAMTFPRLAGLKERARAGEGPSFRIGGVFNDAGRYSAWEKASFAVIGAMIAGCIGMSARYAVAFLGLSNRIVTRSLLIALIPAILPFFAWARATEENYWAYHGRKRMFFALAMVHATLWMLQPAYALSWKAVVPMVIKGVPVNAAMTRRMVVLLAYILEGGLFAVITALLYRVAEPVITSRTTWRAVEVFKWRQIVDSRKDLENRYDLKIFTSLETGKPIVTKENDRFVQMEINGASGTGKTSSIFLNGIWGDLDVKFRNREKRREEFLRMIAEKKATLNGPIREFDESAVVAVGENEKERKRNGEELRKIRERYPDCGMTVVAPNPDLNEHVIRMAKARGFKVNVLDPVNSYDSFECAREMSINPFYIPPTLTDADEAERIIRISQAASVFADVLIATNQMGGSSDVYFTDISLSVSSNVAAIVMLSKNIDKQVAYIDDVHECISDFGNLTKHVEKIESHYGIKVVVDDPRAKGDNANIQNNEPTDKGAADRARSNAYYQQLLFVKQELLGAGREAMFSQARGLRNLINKILQDPRIKRKLSAVGEARLDFDKILANNEITVVSTAVELGQSISTSFGIFFLLLHRTSVLRRPKATRTPHFLWVDECAQYVHPLFDDVIALYRQYRVAAVLTLQTLTQLEKHRETAYLKNVFLGAGTHAVFGRLAVEEMDLYGKMAGTETRDVEQKSATDNSILASNPTHTESVRRTPTLTNVMEGSDMRHLDFQELTVFTIDNGRVKHGELARVFFLPEEAYDEKREREIDWKKVCPDAFREKTPQEREEEEKARKAAKRPEEEIPGEIQQKDVAGFVVEQEENENRVEEKDEIEKLMEQCGDLNEIYAKLQSGEWKG